MALVAEEIVQEWLNRKGYFTIRGIKLGNHEIDILAIRIADNKVDCRHVEVQVSHRPVAFISDSRAKKKTPQQLRKSVNDWIQKKFQLPQKVAIRAKLGPGTWKQELVCHKLRHPEEIDEIQRRGITVHKFEDVVKEMRSEDNIIGKAVGADLLDMFLFATPDEEEDRK